MKVPGFLTDEEREFLEKNYPHEFDYFKLEMVQRAVHAISLVAKRNKKQAKALLKSFLNKDTYKAIIKNPYTPRYAKIEFRVLKTFGIGFHLFMFPFYALIRKVLRG